MADEREIEAVVLRHLVKRRAFNATIFATDGDGMKTMIAELAALRSQDREDGARVAALLGDAQPTISRQGDLILLDCPDGTITDDLYHAIEAAAGMAALPLSTEQTEAGDA